MLHLMYILSFLYLVEITSNWKKKQVTVKQIGGNSSAIDGTELETGRLCTLQTGAILYLLTGQYPHKVRFCVKEEDKISTKDSDKSSIDNKRKTSASVSSSVKRPAPSDDDDKKNNKPMKKARTESSNTSKSKITDNEDNDDDGHVKSVEEKLKSLKKSAKEENNKKKSEHSHHGDSKHGKDKNHSEKKEGSLATETKWMQYDKLYVCNMKGVIARSKSHNPINNIAGFDIDGTIITTQSGNVFPKHPGDWRILYPEVPGKLKKLHADGYKVVFFTNQMGVAKGKQKIEDLQKKFCIVAEKMGVPVQILVSTGGGIFRKPCLGMWNHLKEKDNDGIKINREESFYVGGRPEKWAAKKKKDFSCGDRLFALNAGITFYTPEEYFLGQKKAPFSMPDFDPKKVCSSDPLTDPKDALIVSTKKEVVLLVGFPACEKSGKKSYNIATISPFNWRYCDTHLSHDYSSNLSTHMFIYISAGKSFFANTYMVPKGYDYVNRDTLGSWQKCVNKCTRSLKEGSSVVIDNTNPDVECRSRLVLMFVVVLSLATQIQMSSLDLSKCGCLYVSVTKKVAVLSLTTQIQMLSLDPGILNVPNEQECSVGVSCLQHHTIKPDTMKRKRKYNSSPHCANAWKVQIVIGKILNFIFRSKYKEPEISEGFTEIVKINFVPRFSNSQDEKLYKQYLLDK
ncbi:hypothetical protein KUTeg_019299 [Tegillarca granosa]|uniref:PNK FHA domain-containing protein n=1 Tax=Tegillarca granosa TaxID=220873 RepID=A0ABQ9EC52_TEGGR|nr:hypothetical protein KUTeg_019299 [Tegillarca granosa]